MESNKFNVTQLKLIAGAGFNDELNSAIRRLFLRFATDGTMTVGAFANCLHSCPGLVDAARAEQYFRAFDEKSIGHLQFPQFAAGLAALEPRTNHGGELAVPRCRYIFRFYSGSDVMNDIEFRNLARDIVITRQPSVASKLAEVNRLAGPYFQHFELEFTVTKFTEKVGTLQLRGTSMLFRAQRSIADWVRDYAEQLVDQQPADEQSPMDTSEKRANSKMQDCAVQTRPEFHLSHSYIRLTDAGCVTEAMEMNGNSNCSEDIVFSGQGRSPDSDDDRIKATNCAADMLHGLDYFYWPYMVKSKRTSSTIANDSSSLISKSPLDWHHVRKGKLAASLLKLCWYVQPILAAEERCLELQQPVYVFCNIHGHYQDLHTLEKLFWPLGPQNSISNLLFLGDYVNHGNYGLEVVAYLFAMKILAPQRVFLLRGNHELRSTQIKFDFKEECLKKLKDSDGEAVWNAINKCFDFMPVSAVIDNQIFCTNGGIPHPDLLRSIPDLEPDQESGQEEDLVGAIKASCSCPLETFKAASLAGELIWNDHIGDAGNDGVKFDAYGFRRKRSAGQEFNDQAVDSFLNRYGLSHVIRAHNVQAPCNQLRYDGKCLTISSSSSCGCLKEDTAAVIIDRNKIKLVRISPRAGLLEAEKENDSRQQQNGLNHSKEVSDSGKR